MTEDKQTVWLTMKQVVNRTGLKATTISRYKDEFPEYIIHRMNSKLLEFDAECIPILRYIYDLYQDRSDGRRTSERVKNILLKDYGTGESPVIDITLPATTTPHTLDGQVATVLLKHMQEQNLRLINIEDEIVEAKKRDYEILNQNTEILKNQLEMQNLMNERLTYISEIAATRREEKQRGFWSKLLKG